MPDKQLGICICGAGDMAAKHAAGWRQVPEANIVAIVGRGVERAAALARHHNLDTWHTDYRRAIAQDNVDVVSICVPTNLHPEIGVFAAKQGKHILCEKPLALTLADADRMIAAAQQHGVTLGVAFMRPHSPVNRELKRWFAEGRLGRPVLYQVTDIRETRPKRTMHDVEANGGPVIDMGVHLFDNWAYLFDSQPVEVFAQGLKLAEARRELAHIKKIAYDTATVVVRYASGDIGTLVISWGLPPGLKPAVVPDQIYGPDAFVQVDLDPVLPQQSMRVMSSQTGDWEWIAVSDQSMYDLEIADFARRILAGQPPLSTGADGSAALRVALAAMESIETGQPVFFA